MQIDRRVNDTWHEPVISLEDSVESLYRIAVSAPLIVSVSQSMNNFFDMLVEQVARRNPDVVSSWNG